MRRTGQHDGQQSVMLQQCDSFVMMSILCSLVRTWCSVLWSCC